MWYNSLFPAIPVPPPLHLAVNTDATNRGPRQLPKSHLVLLYRSSHVWSAYRFPSLLFVRTTCPTTQCSTTSLCLSHHLFRLPLKKLRGRISIRSHLFLYPQKFPQSPTTRDSFTPILTRVGVVRIMVELGAAVVCIVVSISPTVRPSNLSPISSWSEERGEALEGLYVYVLCWFLYATGGTLYLSHH